MSIKFKGRDLPSDWASFMESFQPYLQKAHRVCVVSIVANAVAWSRVDTGRMRSGWLPYLKANNYPYQAILGTRSVGYKGEQTALGYFREAPFRTVIENSVAYTKDVEAEYGVFDTWSGRKPSSFMRAPVGSLRQAGPKFADLYGRNMQGALDGATEIWNKGRGKVGDYSDMEPPPPGMPSPGD